MMPRKKQQCRQQAQAPADRAYAQEFQELQKVASVAEPAVRVKQFHVGPVLNYHLASPVPLFDAGLENVFQDVEQLAVRYRVVFYDEHVIRRILQNLLHAVHVVAFLLLEDVPDGVLDAAAGEARLDGEVSRQVFRLFVATWAGKRVAYEHDFLEVDIRFKYLIQLRDNLRQVA